MDTSERRVLTYPQDCPFASRFDGVVSLGKYKKCIAVPHGSLGGNLGVPRCLVDKERFSCPNAAGCRYYN